MSTTTETATTIDPGRSYAPAELARLAGLSTGHVRGLCRAKLLEHLRSGPGPRARVRITGAAWLDYQQWLTRLPTGRKAARAGGGGEARAASAAPPEPRPVRAAGRSVWQEATQERP